MMDSIYLILIGMTAGIFSGLLGIGGGTILIPALVYIWGYTQHQAQGTTLALMVLPIGLLAAYKYYTSGNVNLSVVMLLAVGFFFGGLLGAVIADPLPDVMLKKSFGAFLMFIAVKMMFF
jgi:uncharacterized membrane protein YfcA